MKHYPRWLVLTLLVMVLTACGGEGQAGLTAASPTGSSATQTPAASATAPQPTRTSAPEQTVAPSPLPETTVDVPELSTGSAPPTPKPTESGQRAAVPQDPVRITIPSLNIDYEPIPVGLDEQRVPIVPKHDVGWYTYGARPGEGDNVVFWGHVLRWKDSPNVPAPFARMQEVEIGADLLVYTADGAEHHYRVSDVVWATPDQVQYILPTGREIVTLVSCVGDQVIQNGSVELSHRQITIAERVE